MIEEAYVSFEVAKLLKEKGFITPCDWLYCKDGSFGHRNSVSDKEMFPAPTQQMAMQWLREVHNIFIDIRFNRTYQRFKYFVFFMGTDDDDMYDRTNLSKRESYEEAVESALNYALNNLV